MHVRPVRPSVRAGLGAATALAVGASITALAGPAGSVTNTSDLGAQTATQVAQSLVGPGVSISNVVHTGNAAAAGTFSGGASSVGFDAGVILSSGDIAGAIGPNDLDNTTTSFAGPGDADLSGLSGFATHDASVLELDFVPNGDTVYFRYVFASEEYNEYVNSSYNDSFAFFVNGTNCALVDNAGTPEPITVNNINNGPLNDGVNATNPGLYTNNDLQQGGGSINTEYDGLTHVLTCMAPVNTGVTNHLKLAIADASDTVLDSGVFIEQGSLSTTPPAGTGKVTGGGSFKKSGNEVTFGTQVIRDEQGLRGNLQVNDHGNAQRFHGYSVDALTVDEAARTATWSGDGRFNGQDGYTYEITVTDNRNGNSVKKGPADTVRLTISDAGGVVWSTAGAWELGLGNVTVHLAD